MALAEVRKFPVFFPASREFGLKKSSHETASTATKSWKFSLFRFVSEQVQFQFPRLNPRPRPQPTYARQTRVRRPKILRPSPKWFARMG
jgi:hypothetical protein